MKRTVDCGFYSLLFLLMSCALFIRPSLSAEDVAEDVLSPAQWERIDQGVDRGLRWLASQQQRDGSFPARPECQPAITALCTMAFMANGHTAGEGPYSESLQKAMDYIVASQQANGLISLVAPRGMKISRNVSHNIGRTVVYNHAISSLVLSEAYGQYNSGDSEPIHNAIEKALSATLEMQQWRKERKVDQGGWRYLDKFEPNDSDLSLTGWQLMFLRSAKNAGFEVNEKPIDNAVQYVRSCFDKEMANFSYMAGSKTHITRAMAGAGILALAHAGYHDSSEAQLAGDWVLKHSFDKYGVSLRGIAQKGHHDRYHYGLLLCSQGMYQLGGRHWKQFFPKVSTAVLRSQKANGAWETLPRDPVKLYGKPYVTSMCILSLSAPNQLLPIFQR